MKIWILCVFNELLSGLAYIEFAALILLTGLNLRCRIIWLMLQISDRFRPVVHSYSSDYHDIIVHEPSPPSEYRIENPYVLTANKIWHIVQDNSGKCHIGLVIEVVDNDNDIVLCLDVLVNVSAFYQFPMEAAKSYLIAIAEEDDNSVILVEELQYNIRVNGLYDLPDSPFILKTYWIRIIQRCWRRVYSKRIRLLKLRCSLKAQRQFELCGKYGIGSGDGLRGMLSNAGTFANAKGITPSSNTGTSGITPSSNMVLRE